MGSVFKIILTTIGITLEENVIVKYEILHQDS